MLHGVVTELSYNPFCQVLAEAWNNKLHAVVELYFVLLGHGSVGHQAQTT